VVQVLSVQMLELLKRIEGTVPVRVLYLFSPAVAQSGGVRVRSRRELSPSIELGVVVLLVLSVSLIPSLLLSLQVVVLFTDKGVEVGKKEDNFIS